MSNTKRKFSQINDGSDDNHRHRTSDKTVLDPKDSSTTAQPETLDGNNNETNDTVAVPDNNPDSPGNTMALEISTNNNSSEAQLATETAMVLANNENKETKPAKKTRKRRRKGEPEPDHTATVVEKTRKMKRVPQACDRCHVSFLSPYLYT